MNISTMIENSPTKISRLLKAISQPERLKILLAIGEGEACVCHLEAALAQRQVYISQQLIALRYAGVVSDRKDAYFLPPFYQLYDLIRQAAPSREYPSEGSASPKIDPERCSCPNCLPVIAVISNRMIFSLEFR
jgi:ArsR family transcriptional regulator